MKKKFTRSMGVILSLFLSTMAFAQTKVLSEDFESTRLPVGWTISNGYWQLKDGGVVFSTLLENAADTLISPMVSVAELVNHPTVTVDYRLVANQSKVNSLAILYRTSAAEAWISLATMDTEQAELMRTYIPLPAEVTANVQVAVVATYRMGGATAVDYVAIENQREATIAPAKFRREDLTTNSVSLYWEVCSSDYFLQNNLKVSTVPLEDMTFTADVYDGNVKRNNLELGDLQPNTDYYAYVRYECEGNDYSPWAKLEFHTPCMAISFPYTEDFEQNLSKCYTVINNSTRAAVTATYPYESQKAFTFVNRVGTFSYLFFPEGNVDKMADYQVTFYAASEVAGDTYDRSLTIGVASEASEESFTELKTISLPVGRKYERITISLAGYKGTGKMLAFRSGTASKENHICIDNVTIEPASVCPMPMFVTITNVTDRSARIAWVETGNASEWNLVVATREYADPMDCEPDAAKGEMAKSVQTNPYELTNLLPSTEYYVYVQAGCAEGEWTEVASFKTGKAITIPFVEGFDRFDTDFYTDNVAAVPEQWVTGARGTNSGAASTYDKENTTYPAYISTAQDHTSSAYTPAALYLRGTESTYVSYAMMPAMPVEEINKLMVSCYAYSGSTSTKLVVGVADVQSKDIEQGKQLVPGGNVTPVDTLSFAKASQWQKMDVNLGKYTGKGKYITFFLVRGSGTPAVYVDDITIDYAPTCYAGKELKAEATGTQTAEIEWGEVMPTDSWRLKVSSSEIDPLTTNGDILDITTKDKTYSLTGLTDNTTYYVYVSPMCADEWISTTFTTLYAITTLPYYNDFTNEPTGTGKRPNYWITGNAGGSTSTTYKPYVYTTAWSAATGYTIPSEVLKPSLYFNGGSTLTAGKANNKPYAVMPEMAAADVKDLTLSFWGHTNSTTKNIHPILNIGVLTDPTDIATLTPVATVTLDTNKVSQYFMVDMTSYTGDGKYIVFYSDLTVVNQFMLDNLSITLASAPRRVTDVKVDKATIGQNEATLSWKENGTATTWEVRLFLQKPEDIDTATPDKAYTAVTTNPLKVTGLTHSTYYYVYVRSVQGAETGAWSAVQNFWTATGTWQLPFEENFDAHATGSTSNNTLPAYYDVSASAASNYPYVRLGSAAGASSAGQSVYGVNAFYFTATSSKTVSQLTFPPFGQPVNTLQMTLDACSYSTYGGVQSKTIFGVVTADGEFHTVATRELGTTKVWEPWLVDFSTYTGEEGQIAIRQQYDATDKKTVYIFIDNVKIDIIPQCKQIQEVDVKKITQTGATVTWKAAGEETAWNLKVSTTELEDPSAATADVFEGQMTVTTKELTDLASGTDHFVYVRSVRADKDCVGEWSRAVAFTTLCSAMPRPYTETFDDMESSIVPPCFTLSGQVADNTATYISTVSGISGKVLRLGQVDKTYNNYCALPLVQCDSVKDLQLKMQVMPGSWGSATSKSIYFYEIGIMTDPKDPATYVAVLTDSVLADGTKIPLDKRYTFEKYAGDELGNKGKYIAIRVRPYRSLSLNREYSGTLYIDNIEIGDKELCLQPTELRAPEYDNDTVRLTWKAEDKTGSFRVRVFTNAEAGPETFVAETVVTDTTVAVLKGLDGNTLYYASVRHECGGKNGNSKWSTFISWRSDCEDIQTLPYVDDFEYGVTKIVPYCWASITKTYDPSGGHGGGTATLNATISKSGDNAYLNIGGSTTGGKLYAQAITPQLDIDNLSNALIYFDVKAGSADAQLRIEAIESTAEDAAAITIHTVEGIQSTKWQTVYLDLADYYTSAQPYKYLRLAPVAGKSVYIDNLHITTNKAEVLPVQDVQLTDLSLRATSVDISFTESTPGVSQWIVEYGPTGYEAGTGTSVTLDTTYCRLTGLQPATAYDVYVRGNVEGSPWVGPLKFTTTKALATLPYYYGFEDAAENTGMWTLCNNNANGDEYPNTFTFGPAANVDGTGTTSLYIWHNGEYGYIVKDEKGNNANSYVWATRYIDIPAAGTYEIGLRAKVEGNLDENNNTYDYVAVSLVPSDRTFLASSIRRPDGTNGSATSNKPSSNEFNLLPKTYGVVDYQMFVGKVVVANPGAYQLTIYWQNYPNGVAGKPVAVDSIYMKEYECTTPANHQLTNLTDSSATISWFAGKNDKFEVVASRYRRSPRPGDMDAADKLVHEIYTGKPSFTVDGLKPNTTYAFYQRTICSDGPTDWVEFDFTTNCVEESLPYIETFAETPPCWTYSSTAVKATTEKYLTDEMKAKGEEAEEWSCLQIPAKGIAVLPDFGVDITKLAVQINAFNVPFDPAQLILGTVENTWDLTTFEQVALCDLKTSYSSSSSAGNPLVLENFEKFFNLYTGKGKYIALKAANVAVYIKSITVTELPDCITPQQVEVTDIFESSATIHWLAGSEQSWRIACGGDTVTVSENPYTLTGLSQGQDYKVSVQAVCDENEQSNWSSEVAFTTQCGVNAMPLVDDFASRVRAGRNFNYTLANCWQQLLSTISFDSVAHRNKPAMEVLERLPKETNANQATYFAQKWYIPGQTHLDSSLMKRPHLASRFIYSSDALAGKTFYKWLILPAVTADENTFLTFDLALANIDGYLFYYKWSNKYNPIDLPDFRVVVSTDGGNTFKELQKINLNKYDSTFHNVSIDLSEYAGKDVQVGFYHPLKFTYSLQLGAPDIRLADIRINCTNSYSVEDNACVDYDYEGHGFAIAKEDLPLAGETKEFTRFAPSPAKEATECDSLITLTLTSHVAIADTIRMTICEGESVKFGDNELTEANPEGVPYVISGTTMFGCDSTTYLYLTVNPRAYTDLGTVVIKQGESYTGNGFTGLTEQGIYRDTLKTYQGCDSILSLHLEVLQPHTHWIDTVVCDNQLPFTWKGMTITEENVYRFDTLAQDPALDSIINLSVTVNAVSYNDIEEVVCEGETFSFGGLELSDPGTYKDTLVNRYGCDSVVTLVLSRLPITMVDVDTTVIITDLPFLYAGQEVLDANTAVGTYDIVVKDADAPCTRYNMHIQVVPDQTAIANINATSMSLYPTDIAVGQSVNLLLGGVPQTQKLKVEVCDMLGKCIATHTPATSHLVLNDFNATGIYIVRVVAEDGVYGVGRILVR